MGEVVSEARKAGIVISIIRSREAEREVLERVPVPIGNSPFRTEQRANATVIHFVP